MLTSPRPKHLKTDRPTDYDDGNEPFSDLEDAREADRLLGDPDAHKPSTFASTASSSATPEVDIFFAGAMYCLTSSALILLNKHALASFNFKCPISLLCAHCTMAVLLVKACEAMSLIQLEPLRWSIVRVWLPANFLFVAMLVTSFYSLQLVGIGMFTVLKNLANFMTIAGDYWLYNKTYNYQVWLCLLLMVVSALCGGLTDLRFSFVGYTWQICNCVFTAAYTLYLSGAMTAAAAHTGDKQRMSEFSMVYYNNLLSIPPLVVLAALRGEVDIFINQEALRNPSFLAVAGLGGLLGFGISFTSLWYLSRSTPTIFSLTGSLNKVLVAIAGIVIFVEPTTPQNLGSIGLGLLAGVVFVFAKGGGGLQVTTKIVSIGLPPQQRTSPGSPRLAPYKSPRHSAGGN